MKSPKEWWHRPGGNGGVKVMSKTVDSSGGDVLTQHGQTETLAWPSRPIKATEKCFGQSQILRRNVFVRLNFTSLQATPHPRAGQPAQKTEKQPFEPLWLLIGFRELCSTTRLNQNPETVLHYSTSALSNKTTDDPGRYYYQLRSAANHVNFSVEIGCKFTILLFPSHSEPSWPIWFSSDSNAA